MDATDGHGRRAHPRVRWWGRLATAAAAGWAVPLIVAQAVYGLRPGEWSEPGREPRDIAPLSSVTLLAERAAAARGLWGEVERYYLEEVRPVERVLGIHRRDDPGLVRRIAFALVREANHVRVDPWLLLAVLLVENAELDPSAESDSGARGLMQVMPSHLGHWPDCVPDLDDVDANICHGARIFAHYFREARGDVERALLRYNGCSAGTVTPNCHEYPYHVFARAGRASAITWAESFPESLDLP